MNEPKGVSGWLLLLCFLLAIWEPANVALLESSSLAGLLLRGSGAMVQLLVSLIGASMGLAAGIALWTRRPHAPNLARLALVILTITGLIRLSSPGVMPGTRLPLMALLVAYNAAWLAYLQFSRRVRATYPD